MSPIKIKTPKKELPFLDRLQSEINYKMNAVEDVEAAGISVPRYVGEFWTSKQRQEHSLHEISYRACFKPQLPKFFIENLSNESDVIYDPFSGRGTTIIQAALMQRNIIANDVNPLSEILYAPRLKPPSLEEIIKRLDTIPIHENEKADIDISMFYHPKTESEIVSIKNYLTEKSLSGKEDFIDKWIRMVATNRLTGHSAGFFSVYSLPPNQAVSQDSQIKINAKLKQIPEYKNTRVIILKKSRTLLKDLNYFDIKALEFAYNNAIILSKDARDTKIIKDDAVQLTVTSPPFLNVVDYGQDNWLRCWFNNIDYIATAKSITTCKSLQEWNAVMLGAFKEFYRITKDRGFVAFEVGNVNKNNILLDEQIVPIGIKAGFNCISIIENKQKFTKTSNIWGINNNDKGTNSNKIVLFRKKS